MIGCVDVTYNMFNVKMKHLRYLRYFRNLLALLGVLFISFWVFRMLFGTWPGEIGSRSAFFSWEYKEYVRSTSPNGMFDAIVLQGNAGAVTEYTYDIFIAKKGKVINRDLDRRLMVLGGYEHAGPKNTNGKKMEIFTLLSVRRR